MNTETNTTTNHGTWPQWIYALVALVVLAAGPILAPDRAAAQVEGLSYSFQPSIEHYRWGSELGLEDGSLYGGRLGVNFGRTLTIEGYYVANDKMKSNLLSDYFPEAKGPFLQNQKVEVANYGADLVLNLSRGPLVPFMQAGGGIYRFDPEFGPRFEEIGVNFGGGLRYAIHPRFDATVSVKSASSGSIGWGSPQRKAWA